jgi:hypothetical protein
LASRVEVAEYLQVTPKTLADWASRGVGPRYTRFGKGGAATRYRWADVESWLARSTRVATPRERTEPPHHRGPAHLT